MIRVGLRDARAHFSRFLLSIVAIALGVSFVVGSFCFREMLNNQVDEMMATNADHDVYVRGTEKQQDGDQDSSDSGSSSGTTAYNDIDTSLVSVIGKVKGVDSVSTTGVDGKAWRSARLDEGRWPKNRHEVALHSFAVEQSGLHVGDTTKLVYPSGPEDVKVVGVFSTESSQAGALLIGLPGSVVKDLCEQSSGQSGRTQTINVYGSANGGSPLDADQQRELAGRIDKTLPASAKAHAITGDQMRDESSTSIRRCWASSSR